MRGFGKSLEVIRKEKNVGRWCGLIVMNVFHCLRVSELCVLAMEKSGLKYALENIMVCFFWCNDMPTFKYDFP